MSVSKYLTRKDLIDAKINSLIEVQTYIEEEIERLSAISKAIKMEKKETLKTFSNWREWQFMGTFKSF